MCMRVLLMFFWCAAMCVCAVCVDTIGVFVWEDS